MRCNKCNAGKMIFIGRITDGLPVYRCVYCNHEILKQPDDRELHPIGTGDELEALQAENVVLRGRCASLETEIAILRGLVAIGNKGLYERDTLQADYNEAQATIGKLYALVVAASGDGGRETLLADELIGAPPEGDVSAPDGLSPLSARNAAHDPNAG